MDTGTISFCLHTCADTLTPYLPIPNWNSSADS
jgi:hypothetical protein